MVPAATSHPPATWSRPTRGSPASNERIPSAWLPDEATATPPRSAIDVFADAYPNLGSTRQRIGVDPERPSTCPDELPLRGQARLVEQQRVGHADGPGVRRERRLENVRLGRVAPGGGERRLGLEDEPTAALRVEDRAEHGRRIEVREGEPVDRAVARDERDRPAVPDRGVLADRGVAGFVAHLSAHPWRRVAVGDQDLVVDRDAPGGDRSIAAEQALHGRSLPAPVTYQTARPQRASAG